MRRERVAPRTRRAAPGRRSGEASWTTYPSGRWCKVGMPDTYASAAAALPRVRNAGEGKKPLRRRLSNSLLQSANFPGDCQLSLTLSLLGVASEAWDSGAQQCEG